MSARCGQRSPALSYATRRRGLDHVVAVARRAPPQQARHHQSGRPGEIQDVASDLERAGSSAIPDQPGEEPSDAAVIVEQPGRIPERLATRQQSQTLQPTDAGTEEPRRHEQDQKRRDGEEALHAEAPAALEHAPAEYGRPDAAGGPTGAPAPPRKGLQLGHQYPAEQQRADSLARDTDEPAETSQQRQRG